MIVKITIDGIEYDVREGDNVLNLCQKFGIFVPHLCFLKGTIPSEKCGLCVVEVNGEKLEHCCQLSATNGLKIVTKNQQIQEIRKRNIDKIIKNHYIDCHKCSKNGFCYLQKIAAEIYQSEENITNFQGNTNTQPNLIPIKKDITYNPSKCIFCTRCLKFMNEICKESIKKPSDLKQIKDNNLLGNVLDICPTAALCKNDLNKRNSMLDSHIIKTLDISNIFTPEIEVFVNDDNQIINIASYRRNWISDELRFSYKDLQKRKIPDNYTNILYKLRDKIKEKNNENCIFVIGNNIDILSLFYIKYLQENIDNIIVCIEDFNIPLFKTKELMENIERLTISDYLIIIKPNDLSEIMNVLSITKNIKDYAVIELNNLNEFLKNNAENSKMFSYLKPSVIVFHNAFENDPEALKTIETFANIYEKTYNIELQNFVIPNHLSNIAATYLEKYVPLSKLLKEFNRHDLRFVCQIGETKNTFQNEGVFYVKNSVAEDSSKNSIQVPSKHFLEDSCFYINIYGQVVKTKNFMPKNLKSNREFLYDLMQLVFEENFYDINEQIQNDIRNIFERKK